jgi:hypothetical protein
VIYAEGSIIIKQAMEYWLSATLVNSCLRKPFMAGAVTGIGSLPFTRVTSAIEAIAELSPQVPFWPQLPCLSERENAIGQGLSILSDLVEPRNQGYGYQVKQGRIVAVLATLHRSNGELTSTNAAGFFAFEKAFVSGMFPSAIAVKGQIEGRSPRRLICFTRTDRFYSIQRSFQPSHSMCRK